jgi:hypothetical protein
LFVIVFVCCYKNQFLPFAGDIARIVGAELVRLIIVVVVDNAVVYFVVVVVVVFNNYRRVTNRRQCNAPV